MENFNFKSKIGLIENLKALMKGDHEKSTF